MWCIPMRTLDNKSLYYYYKCHWATGYWTGSVVTDTPSLLNHGLTRIFTIFIKPKCYLNLDAVLDFKQSTTFCLFRPPSYQRKPFHLQLFSLKIRLSQLTGTHCICSSQPTIGFANLCVCIIWVYSLSIVNNILVYSFRVWDQKQACISWTNQYSVVTEFISLL